MADPLTWKEGEGYDVHVLREGPPSKALDQGFEFDPQFPATQFPVIFEPLFKDAPNSSALGIGVDPLTGVVTATAVPAAGADKLRNFLMTARQTVTNGQILETVIRVHLHEEVRKIWLTPSTLTIHTGADERRFTVLALFDDGVVGDITDWPQVTYQSSRPDVVSVANVGDVDPVHSQPSAVGGVFTVVSAGDNAVITARLKLSTPPTDLSANATVIARAFWFEGGQSVPVRFVAGPVAPRRDETDARNRSHVQSVLRNGPNILFLPEGFRNEHKDEFDKMVATIVKELRSRRHVAPFHLLRDAITHWSAFVLSHEDGVTVLGDQTVNGRAFPAELPHPPAPNAAEWTLGNLIHAGGLPAPLEAPVSDPAAWIASRGRLYDLPAVAPTITQQTVNAWNALRPRTLLNERNTVFGLAHNDRPRASGQDQSDWRLLLDGRRTSEDSFRLFIESLRYGTDPATGTPFEIGRTWLWDTASGSGTQAGKDAGLVCIVCRDDVRGGVWMPVRKPTPYCVASAGMTGLVTITAAADGKNIAAPTGSFSAAVLASRVARGCGHGFGLGDEYGDEAGSAPPVGPAVNHPNLQLDATTLGAGSSAAVRAIDAGKIKWLWPRVANASVIDVQFDASGAVQSPLMCDINGTPDPTGTYLLIRLRKPPYFAFAKNDVVRFRAAVDMSRGSSWLSPSNDPLAAIVLYVEDTPSPNDVIVGYPANVGPPQPGYLPASGLPLDLSVLSPYIQYALIGPRIEAGNELRLVADSIRLHIDASSSPLNSPPGSLGAVCVPGGRPFDAVTPTNLPPTLKLPRDLPAPADLIGLYDGGNHVDCGVFRPAGRCRMRTSFDATTPFCHVCKYILVDMVDPTMHYPLDIDYDPQYP